MAEQRTTSLRRVDGRLVGAALALLLTVVVAAVAVRGAAWTRQGQALGAAAAPTPPSTTAAPTESAAAGSGQDLPRTDSAGRLMFVLLVAVQCFGPALLNRGG